MANSLLNLDDKLSIIKANIRSFPDFPKPGILFRDVFSVLAQPQTFKLLCDILIEESKAIQPAIECIVGLESRGFLFGPILALELGVPFVPIRKKGKLPGKCESVSYELEYRHDTVEIQLDSITARQRVLVIDDLLATGGTLKAACELIEKVGGVVAQCLVVMELEDLNGKNIVKYPVNALIQF